MKLRSNEVTSNQAGNTVLFLYYCIFAIQIDRKIAISHYLFSSTTPPISFDQYKSHTPTFTHAANSLCVSTLNQCVRIPSRVPVRMPKPIISDRPATVGKPLAVVCATLVAINGRVTFGLAHSLKNANLWYLV